MACSRASPSTSLRCASRGTSVGSGSGSGSRRSAARSRLSRSRSSSGRRRTALLVTAGLVNALLPNPSVWFPFVAEALGTTAYGFQRPARNALTPRLVTEEQLLAAIAVEDVTLARVAGPVMAGGLITVVGLSGAYAVDIATFAASLGAIWLLPPVLPAPDADRPSLQSILNGFRYVKRREVLLGIFVVDTIAMIFGMPKALFPAFAEELGGGAGLLGLFYAAPFAGALVASLTSVRASIVSGGLLTAVGTAVAALAIPALVRYDARRPRDDLH